MEIPGLTDGAASPFPEPEISSPEIGREDFLRLLVVKLANQDPLSPTDDAEFIGQLAQFSELEQAIKMNENLIALAQGQSSLINAQALSLIGRDVLIDTRGSMRIANGKPDQLVLDLDAGIQSGQVRIFDASGKLVHTIQLGPMAGGRHEIEWDGMAGEPGEPGGPGESEEPQPPADPDAPRNADLPATTDNNQQRHLLADGDYTFEVSGVGHDGQDVHSMLLVSAIIEGIDFTHGVPILISGGREVPFDEIVEIREGAVERLARAEEE